MMRFLDLMIWKCSFCLMLKTWQSQFFGKNRGTQALVEITTSPRELRRKPAPINVALCYGRLRRGIIILPNIGPYKTQTFSELFTSDREGFMKLLRTMLSCSKDTTHHTFVHSSAPRHTRNDHTNPDLVAAAIDGIQDHIRNIFGQTFICRSKQTLNEENSPAMVLTVKKRGFSKVGSSFWG